MMLMFLAGTKLKVWVSLSRDSKIFDARKVELDTTDADIDDLGRAAKTLFELHDVSLLALVVYEDLLCTKKCGNGDKLQDLGAGKSATSPFYIMVPSPSAGLCNIHACTHGSW